jgi:erythritol kinase (D-erythritol 1-phosphate-forming)
MAAVNIGAYGDIGGCAEAWVTPSLGEVTTPDPGLSQFYSKLYPVYRSIREAMPASWAQLGKVRRELLA